MDGRRGSPLVAEGGRIIFVLIEGRMDFITIIDVEEQPLDDGLTKTSALARSEKAILKSWPKMGKDK